MKIITNLSIVFLLIIGLTSTTFASFDKNLKYGTRGDDIIQLQEFLIDKGFLKTETTNYFGVLTLKAVKAYQTSTGVPSTGYVGIMTRQMINNELATYLADSTQAEAEETGTTPATNISQTTTDRPSSNTKECLPGYLFSSLTGQPCQKPVVISQECSNGQLFSSVTGKPCSTTIMTFDFCKNIEGIQTSVPSGMISNSLGICLSESVSTTTLSTTTPTTTNNNNNSNNSNNNSNSNNSSNNGGGGGASIPNNTTPLFTCSNQGQMVTICHNGQTLTVSCNATGPEGHSNHNSDTSGACSNTQVDTTAPIISNIQANNITQTTAVISWITNEVSTSDVYYARNSAVMTNGTLRTSATGNVTSHSITLSDLVTYSGYYYLVVSKDASGNTATSSVNNFFSLIEPVITPTTKIIIATAETGGSISLAGSVVVTVGTNKTFTITPNSGYTISSVIVDGVNQGAVSTYTFTNVQTTHTISATFAQITHAITVTQDTNGSISPSTTLVISSGNQVFTITPATGYQVASVIVDGTNQGNVSTYTFTNVTAAHSITATFSLIPITQSCSLTVSVAQTTPVAQNISPSQNAIPLVKFNATPNCNGTLNSFAVSLLPMPNGYQNISTLRLYNDASGEQLGMTQSVTSASVNFASVNVPLTANQALVLKVVGDVSPSAGIGSTVYGIFGGSWAVNSSGGTVGNNASGNIIAGNTMTVVATPVVQHNITVIQASNGTISPGTISVTNGGSQTFTVIPANGYKIASLIIDGTSIATAETYSFMNVTRDHTISFTTTPIPQPVSGFTMSAGAPGFLSFSWTPRNDVAGYRIYKTSTATNMTTTSYFSPANMSGGGNIGHDQGVQYSAYIVSVDADGNISTPSATLYATTLKLTKPTNFTVSVTSPTTVSLAWTASEGIVYKYKITRWTGSVSLDSTKNIVEVLAPTTSYVDTTVEPGVTYIYWIKSVSIENYESIDTGAPAITTPAN